MDGQDVGVLALIEGRSGLALVVIVILVVMMVVAAAVLFFKLLAKFKLVHHRLAPFGAKAAFWGALAYTLLPVDVLPDPLLLDDIGLLALALFYINQVLDQNATRPDGDAWGDGPDRLPPG